MPGLEGLTEMVGGTGGEQVLERWVGGVDLLGGWVDLGRKVCMW